MDGATRQLQVYEGFVIGHAQPTSRTVARSKASLHTAWLCVARRNDNVTLHVQPERAIACTGCHGVIMHVRALNPSLPPEGIATEHAWRTMGPRGPPQLSKRLRSSWQLHAGLSSPSLMHDGTNTLRGYLKSAAAPLSALAARTGRLPAQFSSESARECCTIALHAPSPLHCGRRGWRAWQAVAAEQAD